MIDIPDSIFEKNEHGASICPACSKVLKQCSCPSYDPSKKLITNCCVQISLDDKSRRGKVVTLLKNLPTDEILLKVLCKKLKVKTGSGGAFFRDDQGGVIEIQGKKIDLITKILKQEGYKVK